MLSHLVPASSYLDRASRLNTRSPHLVCFITYDRSCRGIFPYVLLQSHKQERKRKRKKKPPRSCRLFPCLLISFSALLSRSTYYSLVVKYPSVACCRDMRYSPFSPIVNKITHRSLHRRYRPKCLKTCPAFYPKLRSWENAGSRRMKLDREN